MTTTIQTIPTFEYSTKYQAVKHREYYKDPFKCAIYNIRTYENLQKRYHSEDEEVKNKFRQIRQENNKRAYQIRKARLAEEAKIKANTAS
jgi:hypothetical protein